MFACQSVRYAGGKLGLCPSALQGAVLDQVADGGHGIAILLRVTPDASGHQSAPQSIIHLYGLQPHAGHHDLLSRSFAGGLHGRGGNGVKRCRECRESSAESDGTQRVLD